MHNLKLLKFNNIYYNPSKFQGPEKVKYWFYSLESVESYSVYIGFII